MAITRIHPVKATVQKTIKYICNPSKTNGELLISSYATSPKTAQYDFKYALSKSKGNSEPNLAYHLIQLFAPGAVSYEEAHQIGIELADKLLEGKYSYVIATHVDHNHVHNHICFCAADNIDHNKYHDCTKSYYHIRELNDQLCKDHNLSIITPGPTKAKKYNEWLADIQNLKIATSSYSNAASMKDLQEKIASKTLIASETKSTVVELEHELKEMSEILKYAKQYVENRPYHYRYQKSKNQDQYFRNHDMQLILYDGAVNKLRRHNINLKNLDLDTMSSDYQVLWDKKEELKKAYKSAEKEISSMQKQRENIAKYMGLSNETVIGKSKEFSL